MAAQGRSLKEHVKKIPKVLGAAFLVFVVGVCGARDCISTAWVPPNEPTTYALIGEDDRSLTMVFLPSREVLIWYDDPNVPSSEIISVEMRGTFGKHLIGPIWEIEGPGIYFGWRYYSGGAEPVVMEIEILDKYRTGDSKLAFPDVGTRYNAVILLGEQRIKFEDMWLGEIPTDSEVIMALSAMLAKNQE